MGQGQYNSEHAKKFFEGLGFVVEAHPFTEVAPELVAPKDGPSERAFNF